MSSLFRNRKFRELILQATAVSVVAVVLVAMTINMRSSLEAQGMTSGFAFLERSTGWDFSFAAIEYSISDTYRRTLMIGILNTLLLGVLGISLATIIGVMIGLIRTSKNYVFSLIGTLYVETFRNVPLILQAVFWYAIVAHLPRPRSAYSVGDVMFFSGRGIYLPTLNVHAWSVLLGVVLLVCAPLLVYFLKNRVNQTHLYPRLKWCIWAIVVAGVAALLVAGRIPDTHWLNVPALKGLNFKGGIRMPPELSALVIAIALYGGAYIGEVVRAGLMSVPSGQIEAGRVLGLRPAQIFNRIRLPLAFRLVLPSMTNQYVQLMKATTIGIVVGFSDFFMIVSTSINQSGQTLELLAILMAGFLAINLSIAFVMNTINRKIALKGYEVKS